jgi:hypothetical protein
MATWIGNQKNKHKQKIASWNSTKVTIMSKDIAKIVDYGIGRKTGTIAVEQDMKPKKMISQNYDQLSIDIETSHKQG